MDGAGDGAVTPDSARSWGPGQARAMRRVMRRCAGRVMRRCATAGGGRCRRAAGSDGGWGQGDRAGAWAGGIPEIRTRQDGAGQPWAADRPYCLPVR